MRNVSVAGALSWQGRAVTAYREDDGQEIGGLHWTPDEIQIAGGYTAVGLLTIR